MQVWNVLHMARWNIGRKNLKNPPSGHHCSTYSDYILATKVCTDIGKKLLKSNILPTRPHNMVNFGPLAAEICSLVWGTPANFNGFHVLASLLLQRRSTEANQTAWCLAVSWAGTLHFRRLLPCNRILPGTKFTLRPSLALSYIGSVTARHSSSRCQPNFAALSRGHHLHLTERPSHWALAHILVT